MMKQRILTATATVNENGETVTAYELSERRYATPTGSLVVDEAALEAACSKALDYVYYCELAESVAKASKRLESLSKKWLNGKATTEEVQAAEARLSDARAMYHAYPSMAAEPVDRFALVVAAVITGSKLFDLTNASFMLAKLRSNTATAQECNNAIKDYVNDLLDIKSVDYVKSYTCGTNLAEAENIRMLAQATTRRWTEKGIEGRKLADRKVWQQVLLTVFEYGFSLKVKEDTGRNALAEF